MLRVVTDEQRIALGISNAQQVGAIIIGEIPFAKAAINDFLQIADAIIEV